MELIYSVSGSSTRKPIYGHMPRSICTFSCRNAVAFTSTQALDEAAELGKDKDDLLMQEKQDRPMSFEHQYHVYVYDVEKPWEVFEVTRLDEAVQQLHWDSSGSRLLVIDRLGNTAIWKMKDYLMNNWELCHQSSVEGEEFLCAAWLHTGIMVRYDLDKRESYLYDGKFTRISFSPSLCQFGGKATDGWIGVTATGLVCVGVPGSEQGMTVVRNGLSQVRSRYQLAALAFSSNGNIIVACSDGNIASCIQCFTVTVTIDSNSTCSIQSNPHASFFVHAHTDPQYKDSPFARISHLDFTSREDSDTILVWSETDQLSCMESWHLQEQAVGLHKFFQGNLNTDTRQPFKLLKWVLRSNLSHSSPVSSVAMPRYPSALTKPESNPLLPKCILIAFRDGTVKMVNSYTFGIIASFNLETVRHSSYTVTGFPEKRRRASLHAVCIEQSYTGSVALLMDSQDQMYMLKLLNTRDPAMQAPLSHITSLFEYVLLTGRDWWDVLAVVKPGSIDTVIQRLSDDYMKQPNHMQELLKTRFLALKAALYKHSSGGQGKAGDCHTKLLLFSISTAFKSILRPKALGSQDKSPAERLAASCSKVMEPDLDKVMMSLNVENKDYVVEPATLQSLQPLIQWVADFSLSLLASLALYQTYPGHPGATIIHDPVAINTLRELLVIFRVWGLISSSCLPHFITTASNLDCLALLFKLLTKLWGICKDGGNAEYDEALVDECCSLPSQLMVPCVEQHVIMSSPMALQLALQHPQRFIINHPPEGAHKPNLVSSWTEGQYHTNALRDVVRQIFIGSSPAEDVRRCLRCGSLSLLRSTSKTAAMKAWDQRWSKMCLCGGHWKLDYADDSS
ncbi:mediator of RNA polymerase II transcription subunit 16 [Lingula anatina]|uniref:Mediator of RNA polymerase II transcription subunit 16 n=1 Tax=Lingula anatina TaxID=7574 RepID=A0A1S3HQJ5_LINAN|nr:mediator of RNA polymerase II transcription subunit 16 [Lingula anatina]|eukprot:XP_013387309.1 mediator of RNA polymerase II transcription subunit 16 [Lingula anatina]